MKEYQKNILVVIGVCLFLFIIIKCFIYVDKNTIDCYKPATKHWEEKATICVQASANTYSARCEKYKEIIEYKSNSIYETAWKICPEGFEIY